MREIGKEIAPTLRILADNFNKYSVEAQYLSAKESERIRDE